VEIILVEVKLEGKRVITALRSTFELECCFVRFFVDNKGWLRVCVYMSVCVCSVYVVCGHFFRLKIQPRKHLRHQIIHRWAIWSN